MALKLRFGRFELQVGMVLVLLLLFLAVLDLLNIYLLGQAREALERAERERGVAMAREVARQIGAGELLELLEFRGREMRMTPTALRRAALRSGFDRVVLLDPAGRELLVSGPGTGLASDAFAGLTEQERGALAAGRAATGAMTPERGGAEARLPTFLPVLDSGGRLAGVLGAVWPVPELGRLTAAYRLVLLVQVVGVVVIAAATLLFANWVSRPYRRLVAVADEVGAARGAFEGAAEPEDLAAAFKAVVAKLRQQDEALSAAGQEGGGLGDLVRFAGQPARSMATGVLVVDRRARIAAANPSAANLLGSSAGELVGRPLDEVARGVQGLGPRIGACLERGVGASREVLETRRGDGRVGHLGVSITPAGGRDGGVAGALVLMTDLTEIRLLQDQARLRENLAAVGKLSAGIAHEFRNALGTILGYARMLQKAEDPRVRGPAGEIVREVDSVRTAVDEFLLYARPPEPVATRVGVGTLLGACAAPFAGSLDVSIEGEFGDVLADEALLRRAFDNLLRNAADAAARVRISGRSVAAGRALQIEFEDDGPGIPPELRDQVFLPFFTTRARGTGLGLALVQRTVVDLGGSIEVGQGSLGGALFRIRLPLAEAAAPERAEL